jgi:hypothetical protein
LTPAEEEEEDEDEDEEGFNCCVDAEEEVPEEAPLSVFEAADAAALIFFSTSLPASA